MNVGVHRTHCCVLHGCKYSDHDCPVSNRIIVQDHPCESCHMDGINKIPDPDDPDFDVLTMTEGQLREEVLKLRKLLRANHAIPPVADPS